MFDKVVFAGGGHRCWWQAGFWEQLSGEIELHPRVIGGVSAGAATACLLYANDGRRALAWYERELKGRRSNINWFNLVRRGERLMPHAAIYRKALRALLGGENFRQLMWRAPEIRVQYSRLPPGMSPGRALLSGMVAYNVEKYWRGSLHSTVGQRLGFTHEVKRIQDCRSERELVDLLVASSCTPPFTPMEMIDGLPCLDGGLVDSVPIGTVADVPGQTLVLTTRRYKAFAPVFARNGLLYVQPSEKVAASSWDYTSPQKYQMTYDLGRRDAEAFLKTFALGRFHDAGSDAKPVVPRPEPVAGEEDVRVRAVTAGAVAGAAVELGAVESGAVEGGAPEGGAAEGGAVERGAAEGGALEAGAISVGAASAGAVPARIVAGPVPNGPAAASSDAASADAARADAPRADAAIAAAGSAVQGGYAQMWATDGADAAGAADDGRNHEPINSVDAIESAGSADGATGSRDERMPGPSARALPHSQMPAHEPTATLAALGAGGRLRQKTAASGEDGGAEKLDVNARLADYKDPGGDRNPPHHADRPDYSDPTEAGIADDLSASQPAASEGQKRSGRSLRASKI